MSYIIKACLFVSIFMLILTLLAAVEGYFFWNTFTEYTPWAFWAPRASGVPGGVIYGFIWGIAAALFHQKHFND